MIYQGEIYQRQIFDAWFYFISCQHIFNSVYSLSGNNSILTFQFVFALSLACGHIVGLSARFCALKYHFNLFAHGNLPGPRRMFFSYIALSVSHLLSCLGTAKTSVIMLSSHISNWSRYMMYQRPVKFCTILPFLPNPLLHFDAFKSLSIVWNYVHQSPSQFCAWTPHFTHLL